MSRSFNIAAITSATLLCCIVVACLFGSVTDPRQRIVSITSDFHIVIWDRGGLDLRLVFFSDSYGPYTGSIVGFSDSEQHASVSDFGDVLGIYYRDIRVPGQKRYWTLAISTWYLFVALSVMPVVWVCRRRVLHAKA